MNCPICGAPLGDYDQICNNCGTKRSEMGPAYNGAGGRPAANSYGGGGDLGMGTPPAQAWNSNSPGAYRASRGNTSTIIGVVVALIVLLGVFGIYQWNYNREMTVDMGDFSITFPQQLKENTRSVFVGSDVDDGAAYANKHMAFAYMKYDLKSYGLEGSDVAGLESSFVTELDKQFSGGLPGYSRKDQSGENLRFYFNDDGERFFAVLTVKVHGDGMYMLVSYCRESDESKYLMKFREMFNSVEYH